MTLSIFGDSCWNDVIKTKAAEKNLALNNFSGTGLVFHATSDTSVVGVRNTNVQVGGVLLNKINLSTLMSGVKVDILKVLGTEKIKVLQPDTILSHALIMLGLTNLKTSDFTYVKGASTIVYTAKETCVRFTGSIEVIYEG